MNQDTNLAVLALLIAISGTGLFFLLQYDHKGGVGMATYAQEPFVPASNPLATPRQPIPLPRARNIQEQLIGRSTDGTPANEESAMEAIHYGERILSEIQANGLHTDYARDQLEAARNDFFGQNITFLVQQIFNITSPRERHEFILALNTTFTPEEIEKITRHAKKIRYNYAKTIEHVAKIEERRNLTYFILDQIAALDQRISELNTTQYNFTPVFEERKTIQEKFDREQLDEIPPLLADANNNIEAIQIEATRLRAYIKASQQNLAGFLRRNAKEILITIAALAVLGFFAYRKMLIFLLRKKIEDLLLEEQVLDKLLSKAQDEYLNEQKISKALYEVKLEKYSEKKLGIRGLLPVLRANLKKRERFWLYPALYNPALFKKFKRNGGGK